MIQESFANIYVLNCPLVLQSRPEGNKQQYDLEWVQDMPWFCKAKG